MMLYLLCLETSDKPVKSFGPLPIWSDDDTESDLNYDVNDLSPVSVNTDVDSSQECVVQEQPVVVTAKMEHQGYGTCDQIDGGSQSDSSWEKIESQVSESDADSVSSVK